MLNTPSQHGTAQDGRQLHCTVSGAAIIGSTFAASLRTDICPQRKERSSTSHARNPFNHNLFDSAQVSDGPEVALN
jgi:hypothetical protein